MEPRGVAYRMDSLHCPVRARGAIRIRQSDEASGSIQKAVIYSPGVDAHCVNGPSPRRLIQTLFDPAPQGGNVPDQIRALVRGQSHGPIGEASTL